MFCVECKPDQLLAAIVMGISKRKIVHEGNKAQVCRWLAKRENCTGMVDQDPGSALPPYMRRLKIKEENQILGLKLRIDDSLQNRIIVLCPRLEEWILQAAKKVNIDVRQRPYKLPKDEDHLHQVINSRLTYFERLVNSLLEHNSKHLRMLNRLLCGS